ncbi:Yos1-like protein [Cylindrobasidium torrendii FP15055 ss-10]|uniref:Yos1-like protein n=1 Tax=Cylindrobasidium torrendii FP15055 ss-10 TaxID=1314674 RepID=A0A0D7BMJ9_9AGAR|nr:Yos1-like protein [Cylindrobasidium torrendii FP15055 ss-10]
MLGTILYVGLLIVNAMAVLSEDRFLARIGWGSSAASQSASFNQYDQNGFSAQQEVGIKTKLIELISAVRTLMRIPLIAVNIVVIGYELVLGG